MSGDPNISLCLAFMEWCKNFTRLSWFCGLKVTNQSVMDSANIHTTLMKRSKKKEKKKATNQTTNQATQQGYKASIEELLHILLP